MKLPVTVADWKATRYQKKLIKKVLKSGRLTYGPMTRELEERFAKIHGRKYAIFVNSGTSALKIALRHYKEKYGWKDGDEVIIPALTFVATMNVVLMNNLKPVLVDIGNNLNINPFLIERAITKKTRAIIPVHLLGQSAQMDKIMKIAKKHGLKVIEDSCETMYVSFKGRPVGSRGDIACFSTYLAHLMVTGVGGFITTNNRKDAIAMRSIAFHGRDESYLNIDDNKKAGKAFDEMVKKRFYFNRFGYSDRNTELEAALGLGELRNYKKNLKKRQANAFYLEDNLDHVGFPLRYTEHAFMLFPIIHDNRDRLVEYLEKKGIHTRHIMPLTNQPVVQRYFKGIDLAKRYRVADWFNRYGLLIGCHQYLTKEQLDYIVDTIGEFGMKFGEVPRYRIFSWRY